jgi:hypothetical protein
MHEVIIDLKWVKLRCKCGSNEHANQQFYTEDEGWKLHVEVGEDEEYLRVDC